MEWTPLPIASAVLLSAAPLARPAALLGALALVMLVGGISGALGTLWRRQAPRLAVTPLCFAALYVALFGSGQSPVLVMLVGAYLASVLLFAERSRPAPGRREFLQRSATIVGGAAGVLALFWIEPLLNAVPARRLFAFRRPVGLPVSGLSDLVTPADRLYVMDKMLQYPVIGPPSWHLIMDGDVRRPLSLSLDALIRRPPRHRYVTLECVDNPVGGPLIGNGLWTGVRAVDLLDEAGANGDLIGFVGSDGYIESVSRRVVEELDPLIAYGLNGEVLPRAHGYPARLLLPGVYGFKSVKWLTAIHVGPGAVSGSWAAHGWNEMPRIHTTVRIDVARRVGDKLVLAGVAFAGNRGVRAVQVRVRGGMWVPATLGRKLSNDAWIQWVVPLRVTGHGLVEARAIDGEGNTQPETRTGAYPDGATGRATVTV